MCIMSLDLEFFIQKKKLQNKPYAIYRDVENNPPMFCIRKTYISRRPKHGMLISLIIQKKIYNYLIIL